MSEQELKDSIEKFCQYLLFKYGEYYIDDFDDDTTKPVFDTVRTGEYTIRLSGRTNHIAVVKALIKMVNGLHQAEERMFGPEAAEWY